MRHLPWYLLWHFLGDPVALFVGNIDADFVGNLAGHLVWHFYALLLWDLPALLLGHLQIFDEQFSTVRNVHEKSQTVPPGQGLYDSECLARHGSLHMAPERLRESTTFKQFLFTFTGCWTGTSWQCS